MLRISMEEQLTSMIASFNAEDGSSSDSSSSESSLLGSASSGLSGMSSLLSQLSSSGSSINTSSLLSSLISADSASGANGSGGTASLLASMLNGQNSSNGASSLFNSLSSAENLMGLSALGGLGSSTTGDLFNSSSSSNVASAIPGLANASYEQLLAQQVLQDYQASSQNNSAAMLPMSAQAAHINQFAAGLQAGGDGVNADCGPTSLVMALHELGLRAAGESSSSSSGQAVDLARLSMSNNPAKDGINAQGLYSNTEHKTYTDFEDIKRGALAAGAKVQTINPNASDIMHALQEGGRVVASGTFVGKSPLPWTGDSGSDNQTAPGNAAGHFVEVSSYDVFTKLFTINDPERSAPHQVSAATLEYFMAGNAGALAIRT